MEGNSQKLISVQKMGIQTTCSFLQAHSDETYINSTVLH